VHLTYREWWAAFHGLIFGGLFLLAFTGVVAGLWGLRPAWVRAGGLKNTLLQLKVGVASMAVLAWVAVVTGTWIVYPWYRARPPEGADLTDYPRSLLLGTPGRADWHTFGMEWKEHIAWAAPVLASAAAFIVLYYSNQLIVDKRLRYGVMALLVLAFLSAAAAGLMGAFITKAAPVQ